MKEAKCSAEELGGLAGVSGMTIRRWAKLKAGAKVPDFYEGGVRKAIHHLIAENRLEPDRGALAPVAENEINAQVAAALTNLGLEAGFQIDGSSDDRALEALAQIGAQPLKREAVDAGQKKISAFKALGTEWSKRVGTLWEVAHAKDMPAPDKLVAFGALFYLLTVIDFIPDALPFVGLVDDFAILGLAANYYLGKNKKP